MAGTQAMSRRGQAPTSQRAPERPAPRRKSSGPPSKLGMVAAGFGAAALTGIAGAFAIHKRTNPWLVSGVTVAAGGLAFYLAKSRPYTRSAAIGVIGGGACLTGATAVAKIVSKAAQPAALHAHDAPPQPRIGGAPSAQEAVDAARARVRVPGT
jgi:hypothetical protein